MAQTIAVVFLGLGFIVAAYGLLLSPYRTESLVGSIILLLMGNLIAILRVGNLLEERFQRR